MFNICVIRYGIQYEPMAKKAFEKKFKIQVLPAGLVIDREFNFLACSPDGLVEDLYIIEIKCPFNAKDLTVHEGVEQKKIKYLQFNKNGELNLKNTDVYYFQVQGQLHITNKEICYFVVWTPKGKYHIFTY